MLFAAEVRHLVKGALVLALSYVRTVLYNVGTRSVACVSGGNTFGALLAFLMLIETVIVKHMSRIRPREGGRRHGGCAGRTLILFIFCALSLDGVLVRSP